VSAVPVVRPTRAELVASAGRVVPDIIGDGVVLLFCGINPGLYSSWTGRHFARPGNRFWKAIHLGGLTPEVLDPSESDRLVELGLGITNLVPRASATADELSTEELRAAPERLAETVGQYRPAGICFLGVGAYRTAFRRPRAAIGEQPDPVGSARTFVVANPSGLQARYQLEDIAAQLSAVREALGMSSRIEGPAQRV
jgi:double-stranded uracil-DNA glycosylase